MSDTPPGTGGTIVPRDASLQLQLSVSGAPTAAAPAAAVPAPRAGWLTPVTVPIVVAIVALIAPVTTAVYAHYQAQLKLDLERQAQTDERTRLYLERAISQDAGAESRRQVLRFLVIQDSDVDLQAWATAELADLDVQVPTLKAEEQTLAQEVTQTRQEVVALTSEAEQLERKLAVVAEPAKVAVKEQLAEVNKQIDVKRVAEAEKTSRLSRVGMQLRGPAAMRAPAATPTCARRAYFNPTQQPDFGLAAAERLERGRECDQSLAARVPPADATRSADDQQWLWRLPSGTTCGCTATS